MQQTPRPNGTTLAHPHPSQDGHVTPNPAVLLNNDVPPQRLAATAHSSSGVNRVSRTHKFHVGTKDASCSDGDGTSI